MTSNDGFSVVAPINTIVPSSTAPSKASCCDLLKRCISSMNSIGASPRENMEFPFALSMTSRTSFTPALTADKVWNSRFRERATILARVVLPTPGGPQRMNEDRFPVCIMFHSTLPSPTRCFCPTYSSRSVGRILSGSGGSILFMFLLSVSAILDYLGHRDGRRP